MLYCHLERKGRKVNSQMKKKSNRKHSKLRVIVEHTVSRIKKYGIMGIKFRNRLGRYDRTSDIVSGLVNFRIMMRTNGGIYSKIRQIKIYHRKEIFFRNYAIHLLNRDKKCDICGELFSSGKQLQQHKQHLHGLNPNVTEL